MHHHTAHLARVGSREPPWALCVICRLASRYSPPRLSCHRWITDAFLTPSSRQGGREGGGERARPGRRICHVLSHQACQPSARSITDPYSAHTAAAGQMYVGSREEEGSRRQPTHPQARGRRSHSGEHTAAASLREPVQLRIVGWLAGYRLGPGRLRHKMHAINKGPPSWYRLSGH